MLHNCSSKLVPYLIAANAVVLTLSVFTTQMLTGYGPERLITLGAVSISIGIGTGQACMLGAYLACSDKPFGIRLRWFTRLIIMQWCCFILPLVPYFSPKDLHWQFPWCVLIDQLLVAAAAFLAVGTFRFYSCRGVIKVEDGAASPLSPPRSNVRILDLLVLISLVAVFLSSAMRFKSEPTGFEGIIYAIMVLGGLFVGSPIGAILPFFFLGYLADGKKTMAITAKVSCIALMVGLGPFLYHVDFEARISTLLFCSAGLGLVLANTFAFRLLCYRFRKLPRTQEAARSQVTTSNVADESSHA